MCVKVTRDPPPSWVGGLSHGMAHYSMKCLPGVTNLVLAGHQLAANQDVREQRVPPPCQAGLTAAP